MVSVQWFKCSIRFGILQILGGKDMLNITTLQHVPEGEDIDYSVMANNCGACSCNLNVSCDFGSFTIVSDATYAIKTSNSRLNGTISPMSVDSTF